MDRGAWRATVHWVARSQDTTGRLSTHACASPMGCEPLQNRVFAFVSSLYLAQRMDYNVYSVNVGWLNE